MSSKEAIMGRGTEVSEVTSTAATSTESSVAVPDEEESILNNNNDDNEDNECGNNDDSGGINNHEENVVSVDDINLGEEDGSLTRLGTTSSGRFNILSTMVGGGSLSLPFAFSKSGNALVGPVFLLLIAVLSEFCFRIMVQAIRILSYRNINMQSTTKVGHDSFESMAAAAFGPRAYVFSMFLVTSMCFFGTVGYAVLLRDMLEPITAAVFGPQSPGPSWQNNASLWCIVFLATPLCTLQTLTSLKRFGAASMCSVLVLGCCILYRSLQCNLSHTDAQNDTWQNWTDSFKLWPDTWWDLLDAFPLYISCYVCHYNILTVHNELRQPTVPRVKWWLRSTTWSATFFYMVMGVAGSAFGAKCTSTGHVQGNVLLDFDNADPLLLVGRMCLAITITLAFPMLTIPARDIVLRSFFSSNNNNSNNTTATVSNTRTRTTTTTTTVTTMTTMTTTQVEQDETRESLEEPLLSSPVPADDDEEAVQTSQQQQPMTMTTSNTGTTASFSLGMRLSVSMVLFWTASAVASVVSSIDIVWDLLGSSLSILLSVLIPAASFLVLTNPYKQPDHENTLWHGLSRFVSWVLILLFIPLMFLSTGNAVYHTFFAKKNI